MPDVQLQSRELHLGAEERARHAALSPVQLAWLDFVAARPAAGAPAAFTDFGTAIALEAEKYQSWPLFLNPRALESMAHVALATMRLIETVPQRVFDGDPQRLAEFYGFSELVGRQAARLLADPTCLDHLIGRGDFIRGPHGFACCEFNIAGNLGGWQVGLWHERVCAQPLVAEFLATERLRALPFNPADAFAEHLVEVGLARGLADGGELNLAVLTFQPVPELLRQAVESRYRACLERRAPGLTGRVVVCTERQLTSEGGRARLGDVPVQLFVDQNVEILDGPVFRAQAAGLGFAFNGVLTLPLTDKRNLALLSEQAESGDLYDAAERAEIARSIPWTRLLVDGFADRAGERLYLPDFVRAERERLVIKPPAEFGGRGVCLGAAVAPAEWEARVDAALADGSWVVQELVPSESCLFQAPAGGAVPHDLVWGAFVFGRRFGSCLLRGAPSGTGAVNVSRGACRIVLLEVEEDATVSSTEPSCHEETCDAL